jgi:hypothetical protein
MRHYRRLERLSFIRRARDLGFSLDERTLLRLADDRSQPCCIARLRLSEVERKLADLAALRAELKELIEQCRLCGQETGALVVADGGRWQREEAPAITTIRGLGNDISICIQG